MKESGRAESETFCNCFYTNSQKDFNERTSVCNPDGHKASLDLDIIKKNLDSCSSFYYALVELQKEQIMQRSVSEIRSAKGVWKKTHQNVISA